MIKINLVPAELLAKARQKQQTMQAAFAGVILAVLVAGVSVLHVVTEKRLTAELARDEGQLKKLAAIVAQVEELDRQAGAVRARLKVITDLLHGRPLYPYFMSDFAKSVPSGVYVKTLGTSTSSSNTLKLSIGAESRSSDEIAAWIRNMDQTQKFSSIEMGAVTATGEGSSKAYGFTLTCTYNPKL